MKKCIIGVIFQFAILANVNAQGTFTSNVATGNWNSAGSWTYTGTDEDGVPDSNDDVSVKTGQTITVSASTTVECNNLTVYGAAQTSISMAGANSIININGYLAATTAPTAGNYIDCTAATTAKVVFKRSTTGAIISGTWGSFGEKVRVEINVGSGVEATVTPTIKFREIIITSGILNCTADIRLDEGATNTGKVTIQDGAIVKCTQLKRTGTNNTPFASLTINGTGRLIFTGTATNPTPTVQSTFPVYTFSTNAVIEYQGSSSTIADIAYPNLILNTSSNTTLKTWAPASNTTATSITITKGNLSLTSNSCTVSGNIDAASTGTITAASSTSRFIASGTRSFNLIGNAVVTANETQNASATSPFSYQFNGFTTYTFDVASCVSFQSPSTTTGTTQGIDGITGSPFGNVEISAVNNLSSAGTNIHKFVTDVTIGGHLIFPRVTAASNTSLEIQFQDKIVKVAKDIKLTGGITTNGLSGGRTYTMGTSTIEMNGTSSQNGSIGGTDLPSSFYNLKFNNSATGGITLTNAISVNGTTTISGLTKTAVTFTANGPVNVDATGIFQLNDGGWATGSGTWSYTTGGKLNFNLTSSSYGVSNSDVFWPSSNGPSHVQVLAGGLTLNSCNRTVSTYFATASGITLNSSTLTLNGTTQINAGGYFNQAPAYGAASTLKYNTGGTFGRGTEWSSTSPANLTLSNNTTLNYPNGSSVASKTLTGNLTIDAGSSLYMDYGNPGQSGSLIFGGNATINGNLSLGDASGGDLYVGGNWNRAVSGSTFNTNGRAVFFNGSGVQTISNSGGETFAYLFIQNSGSGVTMANNVTTTQTEIASTARLTNSATHTVTTLNIKSDASGNGTYIDNGTSTITTANVERYLGSARNWYITSPVTSAIAPSNNINRYYEYVEQGNNSDLSVAGSTSYWLGHNNGFTMTSGKGYIAQTSAATTLTFSGALNNDSQYLIPVTKTSAPVKAGFNLVGNPYTAFLDWSLVIADPANSAIGTTVWFRTKNTGDMYTFATHNGTSGLTVSGTANTTITKFIPPMQAFWVRVNEGTTSANLTIKKTMLTHRDVTGNTLKSPKIDQNKVLRMQISDGTNSDESVLYFNENALNSFDIYDSPKMSNNNVAIPEIYTRASGEQLVINGMQAVPFESQIPLGIVCGQKKIYSIKATEITGFDSDVNIVLKDNFTGIESVLHEQQGYEFESDIVSGSERFSLIFKSGAVTTNLSQVETSEFSVYQSNQGLNIDLNNMDNLVTIRIYNSQGALIKQCNTLSKSNLIPGSYMAGFYVVTVSMNNTVSKQKIMIK